MALASFALENYRGFADRVEIELRPLTLFFGYNSAGKSALVRALPLLCDSVRSDIISPLNLDSETVRDATFDDLSSRFSRRSEVRFALSWNDGQESVSRVGYTIRGDFPERLQQTVEHVSIATAADAAVLDAVWSEAPHRYACTAPTLEDALLPIHFHGLLPARPRRSEVPAPIATVLTDLRSRWLQLADCVHWLGPWRKTPKRRQEYTQRRKRIGPAGAWAPDILAYDFLDDGPLVPEVSAWYQKMTGHRLEIERDAAGTSRGSSVGRFSLVLSPTGASPPVKIPIPDTGEGMAQVLPVLVLGAMAQHGALGAESIVALEHPSLHLHPAAHEHLAQFLARVSQSEHRPTLLLETHSENILLGIQRAILDGELPTEDVIVYWVRSDDSGRAVADRISFNERAEPQGPWPPGVFTEDISLARDIIRKRRALGRA